MNSQIWGLWDCQELISVHLTQNDALDARDEHLAACSCFTDDHELIGAAVEIRPIDVRDDRASVENPSQPTVAVQAGTQVCHDRAIPGPSRGGGSCADR